MVTTDPSLKAWERAYTNRVVDSINALRERRGWTIPQLRAELSRWGWSPSVETLNGILSARKRGAFSVGEIYAFARALGVSPIYLLAGMPQADELPTGPVLPEPDTLSMYEWLDDSALKILDESPLSLMPSYAAAFSMAKWQNALWIASDGRMGKDALTEAIRELVLRRNAWLAHAEEYESPEVPALPPALVELGLDRVDGPLPKRIESPLRDFSGERWMETARDYVARVDARRAELDARRAELSRLEEAAHGASTNPRQ